MTWNIFRPTSFVSVRISVPNVRWRASARSTCCVTSIVSTRTKISTNISLSIKTAKDVKSSTTRTWKIKQLRLENLNKYLLFSFCLEYSKNNNFKWFGYIKSSNEIPTIPFHTTVICFYLWDIFAKLRRLLFEPLNENLCLNQLDFKKSPLPNEIELLFF